MEFEVYEGRVAAGKRCSRLFPKLQSPPRLHSSCKSYQWFGDTLDPSTTCNKPIEHSKLKCLRDIAVRLRR